MHKRFLTRCAFVPVCVHDKCKETQEKIGSKGNALDSTTSEDRLIKPSKIHLRDVPTRVLRHCWHADVVVTLARRVAVAHPTEDDAWSLPPVARWFVRVGTATAVALRSESTALEPEPELRPPWDTRVMLALAPRD